MKKEIIGQLAVLIAWHTLLFNTACTPTNQTFQTQQLHTLNTFTGHAELGSSTSPLADIQVDGQGNLLTLESDTGTVGVFTPSGKPLRAFRYQSKDQRNDAALLSVHQTNVFAFDSAQALITGWNKNGEIQQLMSSVSSLGTPLTFAPNGDLIYKTIGHQSISFVRAGIGESQPNQYLAKIPSDNTLPQDSLRTALFQNRIHQNFNEDIRVSLDEFGRLWIVYSSSPRISCFENGHKIFDKTYAFKELEDIKDTIFLRNKLIDKTQTYIPFSYWTDFVTDSNGRGYLLLAYQNRHTLYTFAPDGTCQKKMIGELGRGHHLAVNDDHIFVADAVTGKITVYQNI